MKRLLLASYAYFLAIYPRDFRKRYGREMQLFMREYAREHGSATVALFLFSDLLLSIPREHVREMTMQRFITTMLGVLLLGLVGAHVYHDASHKGTGMGFLAVMALTTMTVAGAYLLLHARLPSRRYLWFVPGAYAAAAASWLIVTPIPVSDFAPLRPFIFSLGRAGAMAFLFVPVFIALMPALLPKQERMPTIATFAMLAFMVVGIGMASTYYVPAALAMVIVRFASSHSNLETRNAY
jgi:hypothetical protein